MWTEKEIGLYISAVLAARQLIYYILIEAKMPECTDAQDDLNTPILH